jgi:hypothetical protein
MKLGIGLFCLLSGLCFTISAMGAGHFGWFLLCGVVTAAALLPVVRYGPQNLPAQFGAILLVLVVVGLVCTLSEGALFYPEMRTQLPASLAGGTLVYLLATVVMVALGKVLKMTEAHEQLIAHRSIPMSILMVLLAAVSYLIYYEVFGGIAYQFFTKQYYPHAAEQAMALGIWFPVYQLARGVAMTLAALPVIYTLRLPRWQAALAVGLLVWIVGGGAPLLVPNGVMVTAQRYIHIGEIFTQNFSLGVTAVWLLRPKAKKAVLADRAVATA